MSRFLATVTDRQLRAWKVQGLSEERIAQLCGTTTSRISHRLHAIWRAAYLSGLPELGDPDPDQIRERCQEIQREWSPDVERRRRVGHGEEWTPAVVPVSLLESARR